MTSELSASKLWQTPLVRVSLLCIGCVCLLSVPVLAQPRIDWQAGAGCPSNDESRALIERLLSAPLAELAIELSTVVHLRRESESTFAATIEVTQDGLARTRVLRGDDCAVLAHASAVIVALAIDPTARVEEPSADEASAAEDAREPQLRTPASQPSTNASRAEPRSAPGLYVAHAQVDAEGGKDRWLQPWLGAALALHVGTLPRVAPALGLMAGLETSWSRAAARVVYAPAQRATADHLPGLAGRVGLAAAAIELGLHGFLAQLELSALAGIEAGFFTARGSESVSDPQTRHPLWLGGYLAVGVALRMSASFSLGLRIESILALRRPSFVVRNELGEDRTLHRPNLVSGRAWLELRIHLPR